MDSQDCIVHIGMNKTGSTSIQTSLFRNPSLRGARYMDFNMADAGMALQYVLLPGEGIPSHAQRHGLSLQEIEQRRSQAFEAARRQLAMRQERALISGEMISFLHTEHLERLRDLITSQGRTPKIVAYVRDARGMMDSGLQQGAKVGMHQLELDAIFPRYKARLEPHDAVFGRDNVQLWHFVPKAFPGQCVVQDFCARLGLTLDTKNIKRTNESLSRPAVALLMLYWRHHANNPKAVVSAGAQQLRNVIKNLPKAVTAQKCRLAPEVLEPVFRRYRGQLAWIEDRMGVNMADLGDARPDDIRTPEDLLRLSPPVLDGLQKLLGRSLGAHPRPDVLGAAIDEVVQRMASQAAPKFV